MIYTLFLETTDYKITQTEVVWKLDKLLSNHLTPKNSRSNIFVIIRSVFKIMPDITISFSKKNNRNLISRLFEFIQEIIIKMKDVLLNWIEHEWICCDTTGFFINGVFQILKPHKCHIYNSKEIVQCKLIDIFLTY